VSTLTLKSTNGKTAAPIQAIRPADPPREFWFIWCPTEVRPKRRHPTLASARIEALRLRTTAPDKEFLIYRAEPVPP